MRVQMRAETDRVISWLGDWRDGVRSARAEVSRRIAEQALNRVVAGNPVETGRSREAWVSGAQAAGLVVSSGGQGGGTGAAEGAALGSGERVETESRSEVQVINRVRYVPVLEYGGRSVRSYAMVRRALTTTQSEAGGVLREWFGEAGG